MKISNEIRLVGSVVGMMLVLLAFLLMRNTEAIQESNQIELDRKEISLENQIIQLRGEYETLVLGCNTAGALESTDPYLRELCDEDLPEVREELFGEGR